MDYSESLRIGFRSITAHKLRSFLTTLGVIFGVAAVIAMLSIGEGAKRSALEQIRLLGTNNIRINAVTLTNEKAQETEGKYSDGLAYKDAQIMESSLTGLIGGVAPVKFLDLPVMLGSKESAARVVCTVPSYEIVTNFHPATGRFLSPIDIRESKRVCVIGSEVRHELFGFRDPIGRRIRISDEWFTVLGVMEDKNVKKGNASVIKVRDLNRDIYIPLTTAIRRFRNDDNPNGVDEIAVQVKEASLVEATAKVIRKILRRTHQDIPDYEIIIPAELLAQSQRTQKVFNIVMGSIAAISLLVGGIGIMNIMLASVTERTKEIGVRRALGATEQDILGQFLNETVLVSATGGIIGVIFGVAIAKAINVFAGWETVIALYSVVISFGISALVGIVFGMYPAREAAKMDPIRALRYE